MSDPGSPILGLSTSNDGSKRIESVNGESSQFMIRVASLHCFLMNRLHQASPIKQIYGEPHSLTSLTFHENLLRTKYQSIRKRLVRKDQRYEATND